MRDVSFSSEENSFFFVIDSSKERPILKLDSVKKSREAVVVVLCPFFSGVIVAFGTLDSNTHEKLGDFFYSDGSIDILSESTNAKSSPETSRRITIISTR